MTKKREKFSSVFEAASKIEKKDSTTQPSEKKTLSIPPVTPPPEELPPLATPEELDEQFKRCVKIHEELAKKVEQTTVTMDKSLSEFRHLLEDPSNFTSQAWTQISEQKAEVDAHVEKLVPFKKKRAKSSPEEDKEESQRIKKKGKGLTGRRRWISMD